MRRNVGVGRNEGHDSSPNLSPSKRSTSPTHLRQGQNFQRKHALLLTAVFFMMVYVGRSWRGALRSMPQQQQHEVEVVPPPPLREESSSAIVVRGAHQSLNLKMDNAATVAVCGEGELFFMDSNELGWPEAEFLDSEDNKKEDGSDRCCKLCTESENCNAFVWKSEICTLYKIAAGEAPVLKDAVTEGKEKDSSEKSEVLKADDDTVKHGELDAEITAAKDDEVEPPQPGIEIEFKPKLSPEDEKKQANDLGFAVDDSDDDDSDEATSSFKADVALHADEDEAPIPLADEPISHNDQVHHDPGVNEEVDLLSEDDESQPIEQKGKVENEDGSVSGKREELVEEEEVVEELEVESVSPDEHVKQTDETGPAEPLNNREHDGDDDDESVLDRRRDQEKEKVLDRRRGNEEDGIPPNHDEDEPQEDGDAVKNLPLRKAESNLDDLLKDLDSDDDEPLEDEDEPIKPVKPIAPRKKLGGGEVDEDNDDDGNQSPNDPSVSLNHDDEQEVPKFDDDDSPSKNTFSSDDEDVKPRTMKKASSSQKSVSFDDDDDDEGIKPIKPLYKKNLFDDEDDDTQKDKPSAYDEDVQLDDDDTGEEKQVPIPKKVKKPILPEKSIVDIALEGSGSNPDEHHNSLDELLSEADDEGDVLLGDIEDDHREATRAATNVATVVANNVAVSRPVTALPVKTKAKRDDDQLEDMDELFPQSSASSETLLSPEANAKIASNPIKNMLVAGVYGVTITESFYQQKSKFFGRFRAVSEIHDFMTEWQSEYAKPAAGRSWQVDMFTLGKSGEGKMIKAIEFGNPHRGRHVFVIGGLRGCDWVAPLAIVHSAVALVGRKRTTANLLNSVRFHVIPLVNVDGYHYSRRKSPSNARHWCDNRRISGGGHGVNLERNWGEEGQSWGFGKQGKEGRKDKNGFQGLSGFSEPETKAVRDYIEHYMTGHGRVAVVQVRCCGGTITLPQLFNERAKDVSVITAISQGAALLASNIRVAGEGNEYNVVKRPDTFSADNTGQLIDWTASKGADHSYALEIKALSVATYNDRYQINPEPFMALSKELEIGMATIAQLLLQQPVEGPAPSPLSYKPRVSSSSSSESGEKKASSSSSSSHKTTKKKSSTL